MNFRLLSVSAVAAISLTCTETASAGTSVQVSYVAPAVVYAPPPRPVYYYAPPPTPIYYSMPVRTVVVAPLAPPVAVMVPPPPMPRPTVVVSPYAVAPAVRVTYAQPVLAAPIVVVR
ncbi:hypothetical protein NK8_35230 [Caballeronia sp. NK8]|uniref:hypothetical protein n=1 Tax=Caballeronia sp. NK8 TaxID=140098 RepID=UPI001BB739E6|nr:hypothetical protein [Caballeronia sp. NK8]BCQ25346.1 hypothetical protein NK8_35230 [Caballeronia sp. NK8]